VGLKCGPGLLSAWREPQRGMGSDSQSWWCPQDTDIWSMIKRQIRFWDLFEIIAKEKSIVIMLYTTCMVLPHPEWHACSSASLLASALAYAQQA